MHVLFTFVHLIIYFTTALSVEANVCFTGPFSYAFSFRRVFSSFPFNVLSCNCNATVGQYIHHCNLLHYQVPTVAAYGIAKAAMVQLTRSIHAGMDSVIVRNHTFDISQKFEHTTSFFTLKLLISSVNQDNHMSKQK